MLPANNFKDDRSRGRREYVTVQPHSSTPTLSQQYSRSGGQCCRLTTSKVASHRMPTHAESSTRCRLTLASQRCGCSRGKEALQSALASTEILQDGDRGPTSPASW